MTTSEYKKTTDATLKGRKGKALRELKNGFGTIPSGEIVDIEGKSRGMKGFGLHIRYGRLSMTRVGVQYIELLPE